MMLYSHAYPIFGKDQPPDLAGLVPSSDTIVLTDLLEKPGTPQGSEMQHISSNDRPTVVTGAFSVASFIFRDKEIKSIDMEPMMDLL